MRHNLGHGRFCLCGKGVFTWNQPGTDTGRLGSSGCQRRWQDNADADDCWDVFGFLVLLFCVVIAAPVFSADYQSGAGVFLNGAPLSQKGVCSVQLIYQHPEQAVNPRWRLRKVLEESGQIQEELLVSLGIEKEWLERYPRELSGGELQRFCVARALMTSAIWASLSSHTTTSLQSGCAAVFMENLAGSLFSYRSGSSGSRQTSSGLCEFQHICYANPGLAPKERTLEWKNTCILNFKYMCFLFQLYADFQRKIKHGQICVHVVWYNDK